MPGALRSLAGLLTRSSFQVQYSGVRSSFLAFVKELSINVLVVVFSGVTDKIKATERKINVARKPQPKGPTWTPEQTLRVLRQQLERLEQFKGKNHQEVSNEEDQWAQLTQAAVINGFGEHSHNLSNFYSARSAGIHNIMGVSEWQQQQNYNQRIAGYEALIRSSIAEVEVLLPEAQVRGAYDAGDEWAFYKDLKDILTTARVDIFIVDNYLNTEIFELYAAAVRPGVTFRLLADQLRGNLEAVAKKYAASHSVELRSGADVHDRHIFVDERCWTVGQSIKDAAKKKPTYMVELSASLVPTMRKIYEDLWSKALVAVKS
jgi:hypothetical protein